MKKHFIILGLCSIVFACNPKTEKDSDATDSTETQATAHEDEVEEAGEVKLTGNFGEDITEENAIEITELEAALADSDSVAVKVEGDIVTTCKKKGCWMTMEVPEKEDMRVTFKDYGFFVPTSGVEGKHAILDGYAKKVTTDVETLKHFAKDAGKSQEEIDAITEPKTEITFVADGVIIKDTK
ncbi:DUF4920 domain-containing protein [Fulvivirga ligni]|uniref:DUF4920 domain-containing protein n=1 Tax=Fulvivirga ligni TaxID=2904246 RepID=UPI001F40AA34|nr:DUF4920 domain-containing protein [Fulvivirga ligni]UII23863.1 DUF4920 domain-containing protein [Fulvivirga ligni]